MGSDELFFGTLLAAVPAALIWAAFRSQQRRKPKLSRVRLYLFGAGLIVGLFGSVALVFVSASPFPLIADANGWHINSLDGLLYVAATCAAFATIVLSLFGRSAARPLLIAAGVVLLVLLQWAYVANHV